MKLRVLDLNTSLCNWVLDVLLERSQSVHTGTNTSTFIPGAPQDCPFVFILLTHTCSTQFSTDHFIRSADDSSGFHWVSRSITCLLMWTKWKR